MDSNTVYVVTGGNRGIGLGFVKALLSRPSTTVVASVRNAKSAASLRAAGLPLGRDSALHIMELDLSTAVQPETIREAFKSTVGEHINHIDVLINNAAISPLLAPVTETTSDHLRAAFETNTIAPLLVFQALWPFLQRSPTSSPKVFMMSSAMGAIAAPEGTPVYPAGAYGPSKAALNWLTRALHVQHGDGGLVAVALHPGWVRTDMGRQAGRDLNTSMEPPLSVEESVGDMLTVVDGASRERYSGQLIMGRGEVLAW